MPDISIFQGHNMADNTFLNTNDYDSMDYDEDWKNGDSGQDQ